MYILRLDDVVSRPCARVRARTCMVAKLICARLSMQCNVGSTISSTPRGIAAPVPPPVRVCGVRTRTFFNTQHQRRLCRQSTHTRRTEQHAVSDAHAHARKQHDRTADLRVCSGSGQSCREETSTECNTTTQLPPDVHAHGGATSTCIDSAHQQRDHGRQLEAGKDSLLQRRGRQRWRRRTALNELVGHAGLVLRPVRSTNVSVVRVQRCSQYRQCMWRVN
jgi:hypothetical protein